LRVRYLDVVTIWMSSYVISAGNRSGIAGKSAVRNQVIVAAIIIDVVSIDVAVVPNGDLK
jgi:hypothetical protein